MSPLPSFLSVGVYKNTGHWEQRFPSGNSRGSAKPWDVARILPLDSPGSIHVLSWLTKEGSLGVDLTVPWICAAEHRENMVTHHCDAGVCSSQSSISTSSQPHLTCPSTHQAQRLITLSHQVKARHSYSYNMDKIFNSLVRRCLLKPVQRRIETLI
jgi:hypothetical protein